MEASTDNFRYTKQQGINYYGSYLDIASKYFKHSFSKLRLTLRFSFYAHIQNPATELEMKIIDLSENKNISIKVISHLKKI